MDPGVLSSALRMLAYRSYAPLMPFAPASFRRCDFGSADAVIISHHAFAVAAVDAAGSRPTIAYVHSPARWAWDKGTRHGEAVSWHGRMALEALSRLAVRTSPRFRKDHHCRSNSTAVAERISPTLESGVSCRLHPPVDTDFYIPDQAEPVEDFFFLPVGLSRISDPISRSEPPRQLA